MDYPFIRPNVRLLPIDLYQINEKQLEPIPNPFDFINEMSDSNKFNYTVIIVIVTLFIYRLNLHTNIWMGFFVGFLVIYYLNKKNTINKDQIKDILQSDILKNTQHFPLNAQLIDWISRSGQFKKSNVLVYNSMIKSLDNFLRLTQDIKLGLRDPKQTTDVIQYLKTLSLNQFQSLIQTMPAVPSLRQEFNLLLKQLSNILNNHISDIPQKTNQPININSQMVTYRLEDPQPNDLTYSPNYNFYN